MQNKIKNTEDVDQIIKQELLKEDDITIQYKTTKDYERVEVEHDINEAPDPRIHGAKIIFDSRLDKYARKDDMEERLNRLSRQPVFKRPSETKENPQFVEELDDFEEENRKFGFRKQSQAEADEGVQEAKEEAIRKVQQMIIGFKREMVGKGVEAGFLDFILEKFFDVLGDKIMTEKEVNNFLTFLKESIESIIGELMQIEDKVTPIEMYTLKYLYNASKTKEDLQKIKDSLNPKFKNLSECVHYVIQSEISTLMNKFNNKFNNRYYPHQVLKQLMKMEEEFHNFIPVPSSL